MTNLSESQMLIALVAAFSAYLGALVFPAAVVAPLAVKTLTPDSTAAFLRPFWMAYHKFAALGALALTAVGTLIAAYSTLSSIYSTLVLGIGVLMAVCFFVGLSLIPKINHAADAQNQAAFNSLHRLDMALVATGLLSALAVILILGSALTEHLKF